MVNVKCKICWKEIYVKPWRYREDKMWYTCSREHSRRLRVEYYLWKNNPNYKWRDTTYDWTSRLALIPKLWNVKINDVVMKIMLWIKEKPKWYEIHHKDCNINNNNPDNLVLLNKKDHQLLHKNFWRVWLIMIAEWKLSIEDAAKYSWYDNIMIELLNRSLITQKESWEFDEFKVNEDELFSKRIWAKIDDIKYYLNTAYWIEFWSTGDK